MAHVMGVVKVEDESWKAFKVTYHFATEGSLKCQGQATIFKMCNMWTQRVNYCAASPFVRRCIRCQEE